MFLAERNKINGLAYIEGDNVVATQANSTVKDLNKIKPDRSVLEWSKYINIPLGTLDAIPNLARGCAVHQDVLRCAGQRQPLSI